MTDLLTGVGVVPTWTLGDRLRKAREVAGMSQADLARATGISQRSVSSYENGTYSPRRPQVLSWALATGVQMDWLCPEQDSNLQPTDQWGLAA